MDAEQTHELDLDVEAIYPGQYTGAASSTYEYYKPENKDWCVNSQNQTIFKPVTVGANSNLTCCSIRQPGMAVTIEPASTN